MAARGKLILQIAAVGIVGLLIALLAWRLVSNQEGQDVAAGVERGSAPAAPAFSLEELGSTTTLSLDDLAGKAVVINFWASWCVPCREEAPRLEAAWNEWKDRGVVVLGVNAQDFVGDAEKFVERYELTYPNVHDGPGKTLGRFGVTGFPETWFVSPDGKLVGDRIQGPVTDEQLRENIELALDGAGDGGPVTLRPAAALVAVVAIALLAAPSGLASEEQPTLSELEGEVYCPTCKTLLSVSTSPIAERMRDYIRQRIAAGATKTEIKDALVAQFGESVLAAPPKKGFNLLAWVLPFVGIVAAGAVLGALVWRWSRSSRDAAPPSAADTGDATPALDPSLERRLDEELARFDG